MEYKFWILSNWEKILIGERNRTCADVMITSPRVMQKPPHLMIEREVSKRMCGTILALLAWGGKWKDLQRENCNFSSQGVKRGLGLSTCDTRHHFFQDCSKDEITIMSS